MALPAIPNAITLRAIDPARNMARHYSITVDRDLFGCWVVDYRWGRIGTRGQSKRASFNHDKEAASFVQRLLKRRAASRRRQGVPYRLIEGDVPPELL
jgi:predicted DNA-binding WGR domain protein